MNTCNVEVIVKRKVNISLQDEIAEQLKEIAKKSNRNVSQWVTDRVMEAYEQIDKTNENEEEK